MNVTIRKFHPDEEERFVNMACDLSRFNRRHHPQQDDFEKVIDARGVRATLLFCEEDPMQFLRAVVVNGEVAGYVLAFLFYPEATLDSGTDFTGLLDELYIMEKVRRQGLGEKLLEETLQWMRDNGGIRIKVNMFYWNDQARALYEKLGFQVSMVTYVREL